MRNMTQVKFWITLKHGVTHWCTYWCNLVVLGQDKDFLSIYNIISFINSEFQYALVKVYLM